MRVQFSSPVEVTTEDGSVTCSEAEVSIAVSSSVAIRVVPVDGDGTEYPDAAFGIVGSSDQSDIATFFTGLSALVAPLMANRGL